MMKMPNSENLDRRLVDLRWIAWRWGCSRQTCRRVLGRAQVRPLFLGGESRNATIRFDLDDVLRVESVAQGLALRRKSGSSHSSTVGSVPVGEQ